MEKEVSELKRALQAERERAEDTLRWEKEGREQDRRRAQAEMEVLEAWLDNIRRDAAAQEEALTAQVESERSLRQESEQRVWGLEAEFEEERSTRPGSVGGVLSGLEEYLLGRRDEVPEATKAELERIKQSQRESEEKVRRLQTLLEESEAANQELRDALDTAKANSTQLQQDSILLQEVRRVLGASVPTPLPHAEPGSEVGDAGEAPEGEEPAKGIALESPAGRVTLHPPFSLSEQEEELLRLVAKEGEVTAEQIRMLKGRRAPNVLDDLLDRLAEAGMDPVREVNDRYSFDPTRPTRNVCDTCLSHGLAADTHSWHPSGSLKEFVVALARGRCWETPVGAGGRPASP